jgi:hypothetical protein
MFRSMKIRVLLVLFATSCCAFAQTAPIGVCVSNIASTLSNGFLAPLSGANIYLCPLGSSPSACVSSAITVYKTNALTGAPVGPPTTADAGGNFYFCAAHGHYALEVKSPQGYYMVNDLDLVDDWAGGGVVSGTWQASSFLGPLTGNASTATAAQNAPTQCPGGDYAVGVGTSWGANCLPLYYQTVEAAGVALTPQPLLNFDGTVAATSATGQTNIGLPATGTPGTYAKPASITTDASGRVTSVIAGTGTNRTCNGYGCYRIDNDGTITEFLTTGALNNNTPTTITLPHAIPSTVMAISCTDNSGRVQSGNNQPIGANVVGESAPYSAFFVDTPSTSVTAYCIIAGY